MPYSPEPNADPHTSPAATYQGEPARDLGEARVLFSTETVRSPLTGIGRYTLELGQALRSLAGARIRCHPVEPSFHASADADQGASRLRALARQVPGAHLAMDRVRERRFARAADRAACSVYHEPNYLLRDFDGRSVVTVHDLSYLRYPQYHAKRSLRFLATRLPRSLARADRVIVPTAFVRDELTELLDVRPDRIRVVHEGVPQPAAPVPDAETARILKTAGLEIDRYLLSVGTREPRKNLETLVAAYTQLPERVRARFPLVIVGGKGWAHGDTDRRIERLRRRNQAVVLGYVADETLRALYAGASGFAYMSWYEGFGLPPLEAMAAGAPVVTSTAGALVEVTGSAALHTPPGDVDAMTATLNRLLHDQDLREALGRQGRDRATQFSWTRAAAETLQVYAELA